MIAVRLMYAGAGVTAIGVLASAIAVATGEMGLIGLGVVFFLWQKDSSAYFS